MWRNGKQVTLFTSSPTGSLGAGGYIEFWGERNDGVTDIDLYRISGYQLSDQLSLITDTASFFLTAAVGSNPRFATTANNVSGNTLPAEPYFMYAARYNFRDRIHRGRALVAGGEYVYSSSYDMGEMWSSADIYPPTPAGTTFSNLFVSSTGPAASLSVAMAGSSLSGSPNQTPSRDRKYSVSINNSIVVDTILNQFDAKTNLPTGCNLSLRRTG